MAHPIGKKNVMRTPEEKEKIVLEILNGKIGTKSAAKMYESDHKTIRKWIEKYRKNGIEGLDEYFTLSKSSC